MLAVAADRTMPSAGPWALASGAGLDGSPTRASRRRSARGRLYTPVGTRPLVRAPAGLWRFSTPSGRRASVALGAAATAWKIGGPGVGIMAHVPGDEGRRAVLELRYRDGRDCAALAGARSSWATTRAGPSSSVRCDARSPAAGVCDPARGAFRQPARDQLDDRCGASASRSCRVMVLKTTVSVLKRSALHYPAAGFRLARFVSALSALDAVGTDDGGLEMRAALRRSSPSRSCRRSSSSPRCSPSSTTSG
jgi:hypothetical protein